MRPLPAAACLCADANTLAVSSPAPGGRLLDVVKVQPRNRVLAS